jgi:hypothetical protein
MDMSHLSSKDIEALHVVADEVREVISERGHKVGLVRDMDGAFRVRGLFISAVSFEGCDDCYEGREVFELASVSA